MFPSIVHRPVFICNAIVFLFKTERFGDKTLRYTCGVFNILMFRLSSRRWFVLCLACIPYLVLVQTSGDWTSCNEWTQLSRFILKTEAESSLRKVFFEQKVDSDLNKHRTMINVQKHNMCNNFIHRIKCDGDKFKGIPEINRRIETSHTY
jgi:hypothetical protein